MNTNEYNNLIKNIKTLRLNASLSQEQLAEKADLSVSYIKQIESNKYFKNVTFITLSKLSKALNTSILNLLKENKS